MPALKYLKSAVFPKDYPDAQKPEVAIAGRSNAGKSSFLNSISGSKVAHVSQTPGKTRLLNFFDVGLHYRFVDMPGYGFAARSGSEIKEWSQMIETYISMRGNLQGLVLLMDIRRDWEEDEELLKKFCGSVNVPMVVLLTKADKCRNHERKQRLKIIQDASQLSNVFSISSQSGEGVKEIEAFIFNEWIQKKQKG